MEAILTLRIKYNLFAIIEKNQLNLWSFPIIFIFQSIKNWIDKVLLIVTQNPYELDALIFCTVFGCFMWSYKSIFNIFTSYLIMCCCQIDLLLNIFYLQDKQMVHNHWRESRGVLLRFPHLCYCQRICNN